MRKPEAAAGFTLVESLISLALLVIVFGAAMGALTRAVQITDTARVIGETNHGLEAAMSMMVRDVMQTGQGIPTGGIPVPSGAAAVPLNRPAPSDTPMLFPATWTALPAVTPGGSLGPQILGVRTDLVTLLYADATLPLNTWPLTAIAGNGSSMTVDARTPVTGAGGLQAGDLILFSNPMGSALAAVTRVSGGQTVFFDTPDPLGVNQPGATQGTILNLQTAPGVYPPTSATRILMVSYYLDIVTDPTLPRLVRQVNAGPRLAIALGTENLQFTYDLVDGVSNPANIETPIPPNSPNQIRKANLFLLARSIDIDIHTRQFFRNSLATDVGLRSLSFVDRYK